MRPSRWPFLLAAASVMVACTSVPPMPVEPDEDTEQVIAPRTPAPMIEYPPIEPVEPPEPPAPPAQSAPTTAPMPPPAPTEAATPPAVSPPPVVIASIAPEIPTEEQQMTLLLADLQRYGGLNNEDVRRELTTVSQAFTRQRTDANRVRLATLYTLAHNPQDDQRALQLLENVAKSNGSPGIKQLAAVLQTQITERVRAVRDEQQKADTAIQKLEALRNMERSLLRERVRGGGGGGSGGGGSSGGGGGSGGSAGGN